MDLSPFHQIIQETITTLPQQFQDAIKDVAIVVEPLPQPRNGRVSRSLLGLYEGVPATSWGRDYSGRLPDKITLFQENIEAYAPSPEEIPFIIRDTLLHEIAHHFGFDHDVIGEMEKRWRQERAASKKTPQ